jgi:hypothetical protein
MTGGKPIAVFLQSISDVSKNNPLVAYYDIHWWKKEVLFFYFVPDPTRDKHTYIHNITPVSLCPTSFHLLRWEERDMAGGKRIAVWSQSILGVRAVSLVAFYDINRRKGEVILFDLSRIPYEA